MKRFVHLLAAVAVTLLLNGCLGGVLEFGSSAPAPTNVQVAAGDSSVTLNWDTSPGVEYWVFYAPGTDVTTDNWNSKGGQAYPKATPPYVISNLENGATYSFTVNARIDGGAGGPGSPSISATPRMAGASWTDVSPSPASGHLNGIAYDGERFVAVGNEGALYSSPDFKAFTTTVWTSLTNPMSSPRPDLHAVIYGGIYLAAGANGTILRSTDATTWTQQTSGTTKILYGLATNGAGSYVAVGQTGTILTSTNGQTWTQQTSGTTNDLRAIAYSGSYWVAVGDSGTLLTSANAIDWTAVAVSTTQHLHGIAYGMDAATDTPMLIAVGNLGAQLTSTDKGSTWTASTINFGLSNLKAIAYGRQFVAVGDWASIYTSSDGANWTKQTSGALNLLNAVAYSARNIAAVGNNGIILAAQ